MDSFPLGGFSVARIGFGAIQLPGRGAFGPPRDRGEALAVLRRAVELGVNHIDTAQFYGPSVSNELIREALHPYPSNLALVSKVGGRRDEAGGWLPLGELSDYRKDIEANLRTLGIDQLAIVNLRLMGSDGPDERFDDQLSVMIAARDEGLIGGIGLSNITREHLLHALARTEIACVQNAFSLVDRSAAPVLQECTARDIPFVPFLHSEIAVRAQGSDTGTPTGVPDRSAARPHAGAGRLRLDVERGTQHPADPGHLVGIAPGGEPGRRRHRARR